MLQEQFWLSYQERVDALILAFLNWLPVEFRIKSVTFPLTHKAPQEAQWEISYRDVLQLIYTEKINKNQYQPVPLKYFTVLTRSSSVASSSHTKMVWGCCWKADTVHMWFTPSSMALYRANALWAPVIRIITWRKTGRLNRQSGGGLDQDHQYLGDRMVWPPWHPLRFPLPQSKPW